MSDSDLFIKTLVEEELAWEPSIDASMLGVAVHDSVVTITGRVESYAQKHEAEAAVMAIRGVRAVANELKVKLPVESERSDEEIANTIASIFTWNTLIPEKSITANVSDSWVTLEGCVDWHFQRVAAESIVKDLTGVKGISNLIAVRSGPLSRDAKSKLNNTLKRKIDSNTSSDITISVVGSTIVLAGEVTSLAARTVMEDIAWKAPGVGWVENRLEVEPIVEIIEVS